MVQVTVEQASRQLPELLAAIDKGEQVMITREDAPPAMLSAAYSETEMPPYNKMSRIEPVSKPRQLGTAKDIILYIADDFDAPLDDFAEYMQ